MKRWVSVIVCWSLWTCSAWAQEGVLESPGETASVFKSVVDTLSPQADTLYNFWDANDEGGEWLRGLSVGLYTLRSETIPLGSLRLGYIGEDGNFTDARGWYTGVNLDLPGLTRRFVPETVKGVATYGYLDTLWKVAGRYGRIGFVGGNDSDRETPILAATCGLSATW